MSYTLFTQAARAAIANILRNKSLFLAVGAGDAGWGSTPPNPDATVTDMTDGSLVWKRIGVKCFCVADVNGDIALPSGAKYTVVDYPTENLYLKVTLEPSEAGGITYRELGIFMDTQVQTGLPGGTMLYTPDQITSKGTLVTLMRRSPLTRDPEIRELFQTVITV